LATTVVVVIVAVTVALVRPAATASSAFALLLGIQTRTILAVIFLDSSTLDSLFTAVAAVVITAAVVVFVIAVAVAFVLLGATHTAAGSLCRFWFWGSFKDTLAVHKVKAIAALDTLSRAVLGARKACRANTIDTRALEITATNWL